MSKKLMYANQVWIQEKYLLLMSGSLAQFKKTNDTFNFRCPFCKDSQSKKFKKSAYMYRHKDNRGLMFHCHHCSEGTKTKSFDAFLGEMDHSLFLEYRKESLAEKYFDTSKPEKKLTSYNFGVKNSKLDELVKISSLSSKHPAKKYIDGRKIPSYLHFRLFYCENFPKWVNSMIPGKLSENAVEDRIVIPLFDENKNFFGFQGRSLNPNVAPHLRYITIILDKEKPSVYNLSEVDMKKPYYIFEGPFDSMFVYNSIAMLGSTKAMKTNENAVFVFDNEPRKPEMLGTVLGKIKNGDKVFIWPNEFDGIKDINDLVLAKNYSPSDIKKIIDENTFQGLQAELRFASWKKIDIEKVKKEKKRA